MANRFDSPGREKDEWLAQVREEIIEPDLSIIDAHHHLWLRDDNPYLLREYAADLNSGHNIVATVFEECHSMYRRSGPEAEKPIGEMEFVAGVAAMSEAGAFGTRNVCAAAIGNVDVSLGAGVGPVLQQMVAASGDRMRGIRVSACWDASDRLASVAPGPNYLAETRVREALRVLADQQLILDCWVYHTQLQDLVAVAEAMPDLKIILDHTGVPILGGPYRDQQDKVRSDWRAGLAALAEHDNVCIKLGALPARFKTEDGGPPSSDLIVETWQPWIEPCIELFGADRCLFESNFPVHKNWMSYPVLWNAFKKMAAGASAEDKAQLFAGTSARLFGLEFDQ